MSYNHRTRVLKQGFFGNYRYFFQCSCGHTGIETRSEARATALAKQHRTTHTVRR
jgi:hypothetical protein